MTTIADLIKYLQELPKDIEVFVVVNESTGWSPEPEIESLRLDKVSGNFYLSRKDKKLLLGLNNF